MGETHLSLLKEMLELLDGYAKSVSRKQLEEERETWLKVKAALELAAQCAIDIALWLVAERALGVPQTYREAFALCARAGIIEPALAADLENWAALRNLLVHVYTALDLDRVHGALSATEPLKKFHALAARLLAAQQ